MYIEGVNFAMDHFNTELFTLFGCTYSGTSGTTSGIEILSGLDGTFTQGYEFAYQYGTYSDYYVDKILADEGTLIFTSQDGFGRGVCYHGDQNYRTIFTSTLLGSMIDGESPNTKVELMTSYLEYFIPVSVDDPHDSHETVSTSNSPNPFRNETTISFYSKSSQKPDCVSIYNIKGECVRTLGLESSPNGFSAAWDGMDASGRRVSSGVYFYKLDTENSTVVKKMMVVR